VDRRRPDRERDDRLDLAEGRPSGVAVLNRISPCRAGRPSWLRRRWTVRSGWAL
jgi:hypothetical protein